MSSRWLGHVQPHAAKNAGAQSCKPSRWQSVRPVLQDFICLSRMVGSGGDAIAVEVGRRLGWPVYDGETLAVLSGDDDRVGQKPARLDDQERHWCDDVLRPLLEARCSRADYVPRLRETVLALANRGPAVFVGRGSDSILPREHGLRVRIVGSIEARLRRYSAEHNLTPSEARWEMERLNARREEFVRQNFRACPDEVTRFDLTINTDRMTTNQAAGLIHAAHALALQPP